MASQQQRATSAADKLSGKGPGLLRALGTQVCLLASAHSGKPEGQAPSGRFCQPGPGLCRSLPRACDVQALPVSVHLYGRCTDMFPLLLMRKSIQGLHPLSREWERPPGGQWS